MEEGIMRISADEVKQLYEFTRKHYVEYYDLQTELVDHLANGIESQWKRTPAIPFEDALQAEFKKFGVFGFSEIVEEKQKAMRKRYHKIIGRYFLKFFRIPKIIATIGSIYLMYVFVLNVPYALETLWIALVVLIVSVIRLLMKNKRANKTETKRFLFKELITSYGLGVPVLLIPLNILNLSNMLSHGADHVSGKQAMVVSVVLVVYIIYAYIVVFEIPKNAEKYLSEVYPEYNLMQKM